MRLNTSIDIEKSNQISEWLDYESDYENDTNRINSSSWNRLMRSWNRLSRLQRSILYVCFIIILVILYLPYLTNTPAHKHQIKESILHQKPIQNETKIINLPQKKAEDTQKKDLQFKTVSQKPELKGPTNERQVAVVASYKHAWNGYKKFAWGHDNLKPVSGGSSDWFSLGLTIVDSLDTALIMGLDDVYIEGRDWIAKHLDFSKNTDVNLFEVSIRVLGGLLTCQFLTDDLMFLHKAHELGEHLLSAFKSPSGIPYSDVNLGTGNAHAPEWSHYSTTAEVTTIQLEFIELSRITGNDEFKDVARHVSDLIHSLPKKDGLVPIFINPNTGQFVQHATITLGARGDSYYEYLLKQYLQTGKTTPHLIDDYKTAIEGVRTHLAKRTSPNNRLFIGELSSGSEMFNPKMDHLTCFLPGTLALGYANGMPEWHMKMAEELIYTCYLTYAAHPTFLAPEITHFNMANANEDMYTKAADAHSLLRPEFVESLWYMYQITGNNTYQDWGWQVYQAIEKYAKVENGYSSLASVKSVKPVPKDMMESFFLSETLKYLYLLFSEDRYLIDLRKYVMNSEAHLFPVHRDY